ncbi:hypothetical protein Rhal01_02591 [Rubritalea halochordaticola]|uniref:Uncharacterized protein n=1 Tax=Rubritalea halochordaticola TaxID=714537 RepID=A0ABP9V1M7_9BACT
MPQDYELTPQENSYISHLRSFAAVADWRMTALDSTGVEFTRKKTYSNSTLIVGGILLLAAGIGLLLLIWGIFEYLCKSDEILFIPMQDIREKTVDTDKFKWK